MSPADFTAFVLSLSTTVGTASAARAAWRAVLRDVGTGRVIDPRVVAVDVERDADVVARQLTAILDASPPPQQLQLLYFGLFTAIGPPPFEQMAGYYVEGTTRSVPPIDVAAQLAGDVLDYLPQRRYLGSDLLQRIKAAALADEATYHLYDLYDYALMLGAAAVLSFFAMRRLGLGYRLAVGFDSGDAVELPAPSQSPRG